MFLWCCCLCYSRNPRKLDDKLQRWFRQGVDYHEKELDVVRIVKKLRELKLLTRDSRYRNGLKYRLALQGKNKIEIDSDAEYQEIKNKF